MLEGSPLHELHNEKCAATFFANVVDGTNVGVIQGRSGFCFAAKAFKG